MTEETSRANVFILNRHYGHQNTEGSRQQEGQIVTATATQKDKDTIIYAESERLTQNSFPQRRNRFPTASERSERTILRSLLSAPRGQLFRSRSSGGPPMLN